MCASLVSERAAITRFLDPHYLVMGLTTKAQKFQGFFRNSIDDEINSLVRSDSIGFFLNFDWFFKMKFDFKPCILNSQLNRTHIPKQKKKLLIESLVFQLCPSLNPH